MLVVLINGLLFGLVILFLIRLFITSDSFALRVNRLFATFERSFRRAGKLSKQGLSGYLKVSFLVCLVIALLLWLIGINFLAALLVLSLILIPGIPFYLEAVSQFQTTQMQRLTEKIRTGDMSATELSELKSALKEFYGKRYAPRSPRGETSGLLFRLIQICVVVAYPKIWPKVFIPRITAIPLFSSLFYYSAYHHRFKNYKKIYDAVFEVRDAHPFRLHLKQILVENEFLVIEFTDIKSHTINRAKALAAKIERDHSLNEGAILVQQTDDQVKFFIPAESINTAE